MDLSAAKTNPLSQNTANFMKKHCNTANPSNSAFTVHTTQSKTGSRLRLVCGLALAALGLGGSVTSADAVVATGGTITHPVVNGITYNVHTFTGSGTFTVTSPGDVTYLVVGGGGGGGAASAANATAPGGGGGAGGFLTGTTAVTVGGSPYSVTVGAGGAAVAAPSASAGNTGKDSALGSIATAIGGGGGAATGATASTGGSGGGGSGSTYATGASGTAGQGNAGGNYVYGSPGYPAGGGGGAGTAGGNASSTSYAGNGGAGLSSDIKDGSTQIWYAGGGGGGTGNNSGGNYTTAGMGGQGGGGNGGKNQSGYYTAGNGLANTGGGGGGATRNNYTAGAGGSGVVIISYAQEAGGTPTITLTGAPIVAVNTTYGTASATPTSFTAAGSNLTGAPGNLTVSPPAGYEVSLSIGSAYSSSLSLPYSSATLASTPVYVRLAATTTANGGAGYAGNISVYGGGVLVGSAVTIATVSSTVSKANSSVSAPTVGTYTYNGSPQGPSSGFTATGSTGGVTYSYAGSSYSPSATQPTSAGSYTVTATVAADANYNTASSTATGFVIVTTLGNWIGGYFPGVTDQLIVGPNADPDQDSQPNFLEFALNSDPSKGSSRGKEFVKMATVASVPNVLTLTVAVRNNAGAFTASGDDQTALDSTDSLTYFIESSTTLTGGGSTAVTQVTGADATAIQAGLPGVDAGWSYKTFRTAGSAVSPPANFIRVKVTTP